MLSKLCAQNVAVIEKAEIDLENGFNVFTGETGAGKSILVDAICAVLGARTSKSIVRTGETKARVTAVFENISEEAMEKLKKENLLSENNECILYREIGADGRSSAKINGNIVPLSVLKEIGSALIGIYGQNDSHDLLHSKKHLFMIDSFGGLLPKRQELYKTVLRFSEVNGELKKLVAERDEANRKRELYEFQVNEIDNAALKADEEDELLKRIKVLKSSDKIIKTMQKAASLFYSDGNGPIEALGSLEKDLSLVAAEDEESEKIYDRFSSAYLELCDTLREAERYAWGFNMGEDELQKSEDRLYEIKTLNRKYGPTTEETLKFADSLRDKITKAKEDEGRINLLSAEAKKIYDEAAKKAKELSELRHKSAERFMAEITAVLKDLNMKNVRMETDFKEKKLSSNGIDEAEFLISVNPGEPPKPLSKIASGGENSRIMLAIKSVMADRDTIDTMIFDEIDTGVSGSGASKIGDKLQGLSSSKQVICITHQAQIAAMANAHFHIEKNVVNGRTFTTVEEISGEKRAEEIAKIMGGDKYSSSLLDSARKMIGI